MVEDLLLVWRNFLVKKTRGRKIRLNEESRIEENRKGEKKRD